MRNIFAILCILIFVSACSIVGIHFSLHNPQRAGKFPEITAARTLLGNQESKYRTCFDVKEYDLSFTFGNELTSESGIEGWTDMTAVALADIDTIQMDLHEEMKLLDVKHLVSWSRDSETSADATYLRKYGAVFIIPVEKIRKGDRFRFRLHYKGNPPKAKRPPWRGGFVRKKDAAGNPWWGVACQADGASMWWACKDVVNDEPDSVQISFLVPRGFTAVSNGQLVHHSSDTVQDYWAWKTTYPINLYNITFYIGKFRLLNDTYVSKVTGDTLTLNHYVLPEHYDLARVHFSQLKEHLAVYEELFGPYPFYRDGFKLVESPYAGMEHQTAIAYGNEFRNNFYGFDYIILHETAHEWWGNSLTAYDLADAWLHEGFATYAECLFVEKTKGYSSYLNYLRNYRFTIINRRPLVGPYGLRYFNFRDGDIYTKGAWILHTLRETIHDDKIFFDIIKTFATRFQHRNVKSADFQNVVNEKTGKDYTWFFDQYLYNRFIPELEYYQKDGVFYYSWNNKYTRGDFPLPVVAGGVIPGSDVTLTPRTTVDTLHYSEGELPYMKSRILVKFTESRKLKREFAKQSRTGAY